MAGSFLLAGLNDTGKTEVYLEAIAFAREKGKGSVFLVPEISLTPQFIRIFRERFGGERIGVWHSRLLEGEKYAVRERVRNGDMDVVVGTRSAVFMPFPRLGLIIVDEEHDSSYKEEQKPMYNTRDVASKRAVLEDAVLVLGSATPSLESYYRAKNGEHRLIALTERMGTEEMPSVKIVDMAKAKKYGILSEELYRAVNTRLARKQQAMLFLNRRGYFRSVSCGQCGFAVKCPRCNVALVYHFERRELYCHYCNFRARPPLRCPDCGNKKFIYSGMGTQRIEKELKNSFPDAVIERMDSDVLKEKGRAERIFSDFSRGRIDILVGTQLISKGWDFPGLTLAGIVSVDEIMNMPDFRAAEKVFSSIVQVAGRTGRGSVRGEAIVQTYNPSHYGVRLASGYEYDSFYEEELRLRKALSYPPFSRLVNIMVKGRDEKKVIRTSEKIKNALLGKFPSIDVLGPGPAALPMLSGNYRWQMLVKLPLSSDFCVRKALENAGMLRQYGTKISIDVDPVNML